jgi:hypothetical protein
MKQLYPSFSARAFSALCKACIFSVASLFTISASAQSLNFSTYQLINGGEGQKGAEYRFANVLSDANGNALADCIVRIDGISAGVQLKSIDNTVNDDAAFQPVIEHMNTLGPSWIEFSFSFVAHDNSKANGLFELPLLAASFYGLSGFDKAQEFAECDLGGNSQVIYETAINNLMVTRNGNAFRAENKWGVQTAKSADAQLNEKFSLLNQQVSSLKVKFGITRRAQTWAGISTYNLALSKSAPDLTALNNTAFNVAPNAQNNFASADKSTSNNAAANAPSTSRNTVPSEQMSQVEMQISSKIVIEKLSIHLPQGWAGKEVIFELYNDKGDIIQKVTEQKIGVVELLDMKPLSAGSYVIMASCGKEFAVQYVIHTQQL